MSFLLSTAVFPRLIFLCTAVMLVTLGMMLHTIFSPLEVELSCYGQEPYQVSSRAENVAELLLEQDIEKNPGDRVYPSLYYPLEEDLIIEIRNVFPLGARIAGEGYPQQHNQLMVSLTEILEMSAEKVTYGTASWYGSKFHGQPTASGEIYSQYAHTAAHRELPLGTEVEVTFPETKKSVLVRINDRGPFIDDRIIDLSRQAAEDIGLRPHGVGRVRVEVVEEGIQLY